MSDKLLDNISEELNQLEELKLENVKQSAISKHLKDMLIMEKLVYSINEYLIAFGRTSNVHDQCVDLKLQILENKKHLQEWVDKI